MKSGAGDDPFAEFDDGSEESEETEETEPAEETEESADAAAAETEAVDGGAVESETAVGQSQPSTEQTRAAEPSTTEPETSPETDSTEDEGADSAGDGDSDNGSRSREDFPLKLRRDNVKDERPEVHQLFVQDTTHDHARDAERELEDRLGGDLYRLDAREAIYLAGMQNLDDAEAILREWGYDL